MHFEIWDMQKNVFRLLAEHKAMPVYRRPLMIIVVVTYALITVLVGDYATIQLFGAVTKHCDAPVIKCPPAPPTHRPAPHPRAQWVSVEFMALKSPVTKKGLFDRFSRL